jgi:putative transposase
VNADQADYRITTMCRVLEVSRSGYYAWLGREPSARAQANTVLLEQIQEIHEESDGTYGAPRMHAELSEGDTPASLNRVARLMKQAGIQGVSRRKGVRTTWPHIPQMPRAISR